MNEFSQIMQVEFPHGIGAVDLCSTHCDSQLRCNLFVSVSKRNEANDFAFPRRQLAQRPVLINMIDRRIEKSSQHNTRQLATQEALS